MRCAKLLATLTLLIASTAGCKMCGHPYDYCGPTCGRDGGPCCGVTQRAGSVIEPCGAPIGTVAPATETKPSAGAKPSPAYEPPTPPSTVPEPPTPPPTPEPPKPLRQTQRRVPAAYGASLPGQPARGATQVQ